MQIKNGDSGALVRAQMNASFQPYLNRAALISATVPEGVSRVSVVGVGEYRREDAAPVAALTSNSGAVKWVPEGQVTMEHFGAVGDGVSNDTAAWNLANDYIYAAKVPLHGMPGKTYALTNTTLGGVFIGPGRGNGGLCVHPATPTAVNWLENRDVPSGATRTERQFGLFDCDIDGSARVMPRWLSKADGTPVTDPQTDYIMGSGLLAAGITGVVLTATVAGGVVTGLTLVNGGTGFKTHPTHPYLPNTVSLKLSGGGGHGAQAYATITGNTLSSVTLTAGGTGYATAPTVTTLGGYADIALLTTPAVDRRNPNYPHAGQGVFFAKCITPTVERVRFKGFRSRVLLDAGCLGARFRMIEFTDCGKNDGPFHCIWVQSYGNPGSTDPWYMPSENPLVEDVTAYAPERSAIMFNPQKGGTLRRLTAYNAGESAVFAPSPGKEGGQTLIEGCRLLGGTLTDIAAQHIETNGVKNLTIRDCYFEGSVLDAIGATAGANLRIIDNTFVDCGRSDAVYPYGPYSERFGYNQGSRPLCGTNLTEPAILQIGVYSTMAGGGVMIRNNAVSDSRANKTRYFVAQTKSGTNGRGSDIVIEDNNLTAAGLVDILDTSIPAVWSAALPVVIRGNLGHNSEGPVSQTFTPAEAAADIHFQPGFRPSRVEVRIVHTEGSEVRTYDGGFSWRRASPYFVASGTALSASGAGVSGVVSSGVGMITNTAGSTVYALSFGQWLEKGVRLSYTRASGGVVAVTLVAYP